MLRPIMRSFGTARMLDLSKCRTFGTGGKAVGQDDASGSRYEDYHSVSKVYDNMRFAGGYEVILGALTAGRGPIHEQTVLDMGCGTGNYSAALVSHLGKLICFDGNSSMLEKCQEKVTAVGADTEVEFVQGLLPTLPFEDASIDGITCNVVIHHIESPETRKTWENTRAVIAEAHRVLKPGGVLCFNHVNPDQVDAFWFLHYVPECRERFRDTLVPPDELQSFMGDAGFGAVEMTVPTSYCLFPEKYYLETDGPVHANWRAATSMWALGEADELDVAIRRVQADNESGRVDGIIEEYEDLREVVGHTAFIYGQKKQ